MGSEERWWVSKVKVEVDSEGKTRRGWSSAGRRKDVGLSLDGSGIRVIDEVRRGSGTFVRKSLTGVYFRHIRQKSTEMPEVRASRVFECRD